MRDQFLEYYDPTEDEVSNLWGEAVFIFDTNVLLNLYRYTETTRADFISALEELGDKLILPYQVGYEYHANRAGVIRSLQRAHSDLMKEISDLFHKQIFQNINKYKRHPSIEIGRINSLAEQCLKGISEELDRQKGNHPDFATKDVVLEQLTKIYTNKVAERHTKQELKKIYLEGKERYEHKVPPGYRDLEGKKSKGERHVYGDLIIWKEVIEIGKRKQKPIVFITDDRKDDWWEIDSNGQTIRPRVELIKEFFDETGKRILIYSADGFLQHANEQKITSTIRTDSIQEVKDVRKADQKHYNLTKELLGIDHSNFIKKFYPWSSGNAIPDKSWMNNFGNSKVTLNPEQRSIIERYLELRESLNEPNTLEAAIDAYISTLELEASPIKTHSTDENVETQDEISQVEMPKNSPPDTGDAPERTAST